MPATSDSARLAAHNERRHPAKQARSCASKPHRGFDCFATAQSRPRGLRGCEHGATVERSETGERAMFAPAGRITARAGLRSKVAAIVLAAKRSPLGTPKLWSRSKKAKPCRSAARFLTLFCFSPSGPSGAKTGRRGRRPLQIIVNLIVGANIVRPQTEKRRKRLRAHTVRPYILYPFVENLGPEGQ